jgi:hypothetical protein
MIGYRWHEADSDRSQQACSAKTQFQTKATANILTIFQAFHFLCNTIKTFKQPLNSQSWTKTDYSIFVISPVYQGVWGVEI